MKSLKYFYNISERFDNKFNLIKNSSILSTPSKSLIKKYKFLNKLFLNRTFLKLYYMIFLRNLVVRKIVVINKITVLISKKKYN